MLPEGLKSKAEERAKQLHVSLGELLREAVQAYLEREDHKWSDDPLVAGNYAVKEPAPPDVSANIDRYIYGVNR
jgi:hypothetical protein